MNIVTANRIVSNAEFQNRVQYLMVKAAIAVLNGEAPTSEDILLGQRILKGTESVVMWARGVMTNSTIMAGAHEDSGATIQDTDIEFQINAQWPAYAK